MGNTCCACIDRDKEKEPKETNDSTILSLKNSGKKKRKDIKVNKTMVETDIGIQNEVVKDNIRLKASNNMGLIGN